MAPACEAVSSENVYQYVKGCARYKSFLAARNNNVRTNIGCVLSMCVVSTVDLLETRTLVNSSFQNDTELHTYPSLSEGISNFGFRYVRFNTWSNPLYIYGVPETIC